ncbi:cadherin-5 [Clupea harengus]|uniref:Cadherin-5 n=1 Tax=Clupea harengus TaxID=7950 RepID=A0A6P8F7U8_CLUHA|nr:cadherin-5 [Clupea harengus]
MMRTSGGVWGLRLLVVALLLCVAQAQYGPPGPPGAGSWDWKRLFASEEKEVTDPQEKIATLSNKKFNKDTHMYRIEGEGANTIFLVNDQGDISVNDKLDREKKSLYHLKARLIDRSTNRDVEEPSDFLIQVQDINDNAPVFQGPFKGSIQEMSATGTMVMKVNATDKDDPTTSNGMVRYMLLNGTDLFTIHEKEGVIRTKVANLDRESISEYKIIVQAKDMPGQPNGIVSTSTITISVTDVNDNLATFKMTQYVFRVSEDVKPDFKIGTVEVEDKDEEQNKNPKFRIEERIINELLDIKQDQHKNGVLFLKQPLDYETKNSYRFTVFVTEDIVKFPGLQQNTNVKNKAEVLITVTDVDEPPVFSKPEYNISVLEETFPHVFREVIKARDPDRDNHPIRYSIEDSSCPVEINPVDGTLSLKTKLDRELTAVHRCPVTAEENILDGKKSYVMVNLVVQDINDNAPKLFNGEIFVCESDKRGTVIGILSATDKDEIKGRFTFRLAKQSHNFTLTDNNDGKATLGVKQGGFRTEDSAEHVIEIEVGDGTLKSIEPLHIRVCQCNGNRTAEYCKPHRRQVGVSVHALITILLCIVTILVIVILLVLRRRYQKDSLVAMGKSSGEIHEQLVTYDEEGGGEMDTNGYDVSILTSARHDATLLPGPGLYAMVKKPQACKGDMAAMIEVKKDEADHDRDGIPYDTLHIYGYEGPGSLAGSLSSLGSSSSGDSMDYDFLNDWGPRFRTLAELYGVDCYPGDCPY